ncbi:phage baseplate assembly protein V [Jeongeupia chitinilytica]|uniref:Baseplate assembly protein n=1 Tax=Jeongeupia chitinilytica TaxID=1041641 RepID=A0ABQ3GZE4_9NEIS|nr:phage baseplate assembly protein V [Jeongeupia chitinilytica]GHD59859.1 baseplate assembly protein [Jeongeupia chitinilytica]
MSLPAEQPRRLESLIRTGTIAGVDHDNALCRVQTGGLQSEWLHWITLRAGTTRTWNAPTVGEQCLVLSPSGETAAGIVLVGLYSDANPAPSASPDEHMTQYPDGAVIRYNHAAGALDVTGIKTAMIEASDMVTVDCPKSEFSGDVLIKGNLVVKGKATIEQLLSYLAGLSGNGGAGGKSKITGDFIHEGGQLSSNGVVLHLHIHVDSIGGSTGGPQ